MNPFRPGDRVQLDAGHPRPLPPDLHPAHAYVVEDVVLDRVQVEGRLYFASRFMLLGESP